MWILAYPTLSFAGFVTRLDGNDPTSDELYILPEKLPPSSVFLARYLVLIRFVSCPFEEDEAQFVWIKGELQRQR
jgi:hypothetical protein